MSLGPLLTAWTLLAAIGVSASLDTIREYFQGDTRLLLQRRKFEDFGESIVTRARGFDCYGWPPASPRSLPSSDFVVPSAHFNAAASETRSCVSAYLTLLLLVSIAWLTVNWALSLSAVFAVRDRVDSFTALATAARFSKDRASGLWAIHFWFGLAHLSLFFVATTAASVVLGMAQLLPVVIVLTGLLIVTMLYFVAADSIRYRADGRMVLPGRIASRRSALATRSTHRIQRHHGRSRANSGISNNIHPVPA